MIAFDVNGNPDYKPKKRIDSIIQKLSGTMWVDEQAREIVRLEAHFAESVKIGGGLVASLRKARISFSSRKKLTARSGCRPTPKCTSADASFS